MPNNLQKKIRSWDEAQGVSVLKQMALGNDDAFAAYLSSENSFASAIQRPQDRIWLSVPIVSTVVFREVEGEKKEIQRLEPYSISISPPMRQIIAGHNSKCVSIHTYISSKFIGDVADTLGRRCGSSIIKPVFGVLDAEMSNLVQSVLVNLCNDTLSEQMRFEYIFQSIASRLLSCSLFSEGDFTDKHQLVRLGPSHLKRVFDYIEEMLGSKVDIQELASLVFLGKSTFIKRFKETTGIAPHQYIMKARVRCAKRMLMDRNFELAHIAQACGFSDQPHFSNVFKRLEGVTPLQYRTLRR